MLKTRFLFVLFVVGLSSLSAQKISNSVINSTGGSNSIGAFNFSYAVGEPITTTINDTKNAATQGFLQPEFRTQGRFFVAVGQGCDFVVYPNPVGDLMYANRDIRGITFDIFNDIGQLMGSFKTDTNNAIDVSNFAAGTYFIRLFCDVNRNKILKFVKY
jgi:Secretion system C-terminal sorting domain